MPPKALWLAPPKATLRHLRWRYLVAVLAERIEKNAWIATGCRRMPGLLLGATVAVAIAACGGAAAEKPPVDAVADTAAVAQDSATADAQAADVTGADGTTSVDSQAADTETSISPKCFDGLAPWPWSEPAATQGYDKTVGDFTVDTLDGPLGYKEGWDGCDHWVVVLYNPTAQNVEAFWKSTLLPLFKDAAPNTRYLFATVGGTPAQRKIRAEAMQIRVIEALNGLPAEQANPWFPRCHFLTSDAKAIPAVAAGLAVAPWESFMTLDRHQRLREGWSVSVLEAGGWQPRIEQVRFWARYFNWSYALDAAQSQELQVPAQPGQPAPLLVRVADAVEYKSLGWSANHPPYEWQLPAAETLKKYGKLTVDLRADCPGAGHPFVKTCGEWDTVGGVFLCADAACTPEKRRRFVKWITPYSSPGRFVMDATAELPHLLAAQDAQGKVRITLAGGDNDVGPYTYRYTIDLRLSVDPDGLHPVATETLVPEGNRGWDANYHKDLKGLALHPPAKFKKALLVARISGHGMAQTTNCAEFCSFRHTFAVGGKAFSHDYVTEQVWRCAAMVDQGVTPNQGGTWVFDRSSWCPGGVTEEWQVDVTSALQPGQETAVLHTSELVKVPGQTGGGSMDERVEVLYFE